MSWRSSLQAKRPFKGAKIGVLLGGMSDEREISLKTGHAIANALHANGHAVEEIDVGKDICVQLKRKNIEVAFIALHGRWGEDGTIQGLLEILGIPYTGSGVTASAVAMDKILSKQILLHAGLPTPPFEVITTPSATPLRPLPLVVKPALEGSTIGVSIVREPAAWQEALNTAFRHDARVLVETYVEGKEMTAAILNGTPLPLIHIEPIEGFYDYTSKYTPGRTLYHVPAPLDITVSRQLQDMAVQAFDALGCAGCARVDIILSEKTGPTILEVNTIPGMTPTSLVPKAAAAAGINFSDLVEAILSTASLKTGHKGGQA